MKAFIITQADIDLLLTKIDRDPRHGADGGSSQTVDKEEQRAFNEAHRFYNYQVRTWVNSISKD